MTISNALLDSLLADYQTPEDLIGEGGLLKQLTSGWWNGRYRRK